MDVHSKAKKILITGYNGFSGKHLTVALRKKHYEIFGIVREKPENNCEFQADISDINTLRPILEKINPDFIVHLAAISFAAHDQVEDFYRVNTIGTTNLLQALEDVRVSPKKIIIASSASVYGNLYRDLLKETDTPQPVNHYGASKYAMENMVRTWFDKFPILVTRPFNYTGPGQDSNFLVPKIVRYFKEQKKEIPLGNTEIVRDISDIRFLVDVYIRLLESSFSSEIVNVCSGIGYSIQNILEFMFQISGHQIQIYKDQALIRETEIKKLVGSNEKLLSMLGKFPTFKFEENLQLMYDA